MNNAPNFAHNAFRNYIEWRLKTDPLPWFTQELPDGTAELVTRNNTPVVQCTDIKHAETTLSAILDGTIYDPPLLDEKNDGAALARA